MSIFDKKWVKDSDDLYILTVDGEVVVAYIRSSSEERERELTKHYVELH